MNTVHDLLTDTKARKRQPSQYWTDNWSISETGQMNNSNEQKT